MNFNIIQNKESILLWIFISILILSLDKLPIYLSILLLIIVAIGIKLFQNSYYINEHFIDQCENCENPYAIQIQLPNIPLFDNLSPAENKPNVVTLEPVNIIKSDENKQKNPNQPTPEIVQTISEKAQNISSICLALEQSGFDPKWTYDDVQMLMQTEEGKQRIKKINDDTINKTGLKQINNQNIANCYPKYITNYICKPKQQTCDVDLNKANLLINQQGKTIESLKQTINNLEKSKDINIPTDITDIRLQNQIMNETANNNNNNKQITINNSTCNLSNIENEIKTNVEQFYESSFNQIQKTLPSAEIDKIKTQFLNLTDIIYNKARLEFEQLINIYQAQNIDKWQKDLVTRKIYSTRGHPVPGTDFYIPWTIFDKYVICFGQK